MNFGQRFGLTGVVYARGERSVLEICRETEIGDNEILKGLDLEVEIRREIRNMTLYCGVNRKSSKVQPRTAASKSDMSRS